MRTSIRLEPATAVIVIAGAGYSSKRRRDNRVLHIERDPVMIARLADLLITLGDESHAWMEWPTVSLVFLGGDATLAEFGVLGDGAWVRTPSDGDRTVPNAEALSTWLASVGAAAP